MTAAMDPTDSNDDSNVPSFVPLSCVRALTCRRARGMGWDDRRGRSLIVIPSVILITAGDRSRKHERRACGPARRRARFMHELPVTHRHFQQPSDAMTRGPGSRFRPAPCSRPSPDNTVLLDLPLPPDRGLLGRVSLLYVGRINRTIHEVATARGLPVVLVSTHFLPHWREARLRLLPPRSGRIPRLDPRPAGRHLRARAPGAGSVCVSRGPTSPRQCGQTRTGWVTWPQASCTRTTGDPAGPPACCISRR
jgi:hypothetical protein